MEDRATTTSDLEEDSAEEPTPESVTEGLPEETHSVEATAAGIDPDTPEAVEPVIDAIETNTFEVPAVTPAVAVTEVTGDDSAEETEAAEVAEESEEPTHQTALAAALAAATVEVTPEPELDTEPAEEAEPEPAPEPAEGAEPVEASVEESQPEESSAEEAAADKEPAGGVVAEEPTADVDAEGVDAEAEESDVAGPASPYDLPGDWYVIHSYSGYENKVKVNLETRIHSMHMEGEIFDVVIPMEDVVEIKGGRKVTVPKKVFPGYILVRMYMSDDSWFGVRNTPGVTGFVGSGTKPTPLSRREVERILGVKKPEEGEKAAPRFKPAWDVGETVRVVDGPFADFNGVIEEINLDQSKVRVLVNIFGRDTPVELNFEQIVKL